LVVPFAYEAGKAWCAASRNSLESVGDDRAERGRGVSQIIRKTGPYLEPDALPLDQKRPDQAGESALPAFVADNPSLRILQPLDFVKQKTVPNHGAFTALRDNTFSELSDASHWKLFHKSHSLGWL
jgi:hypothetical protein